MTTILRRFAKPFVEGLVVVTIVLVVYGYQTRNLLPTDSEQAPALGGQTLDGSRFELHASGAPATLVYFFAPWCRVCAASSGNINWLRKIRGDNDLRIVLVALDWKTPDEVREYVQRHEIAVPVVLGDSQVARDWNIYAFPTYYMIDSEQRVVRRDLGYTTMAGLWLRSVLVD